MSKLEPYLRTFQVADYTEENHPLRNRCSSITVRGLTPGKLAKARLARMVELRNEVSDRDRKISNQAQIDREVALKKAGLWKPKTDDTNNDVENEVDRDEEIDSISFDKLVDIHGIHSMDDSKLSEVDLKKIKDNFENRECRKVIEFILIANGELPEPESPLEKDSNGSTDI